MSNDLSFTPVPRQSARHDGWSAECQQAFIAALSEYGIVRAAAEKVGKGHASAYRLRSAEGAESFAAAWDAALNIGMSQLQDVAMDRAINGVAIPQFHKGEQVGETRWYDNRLLMFMLRQTHTRRFGKHAADHDFAEEVLRTQAAQEEKRLNLIREADMMIEHIREMIDEHEAAGTPVPEELTDKAERMADLVAQLSKVDSLREAEAHFNHMVSSGKMDVRTANIFRKRQGLPPTGRSLFP